MQYLDKRCPNCNFLLEHTSNTSWKFGNPLVNCPKCRTILIDEKKKELYMLSSWDYFTYFLWSFIGIITISCILALIVYGIFSELLSLDNLSSIIISFISLLLFLTIFSSLTIKQYKKEKED